MSNAKTSSTLVAKTVRIGGVESKRKKKKVLIYIGKLGCYRVCSVWDEI